jgi:general secretion pathway protein I
MELDTLQLNDMEVSQNSDFIQTAALQKKIYRLHINHMRCGKFFPAPYILANSEFLVTSMRHTHRHNAGFTLLEVLVALVIVGTALGASLRAVGSLTQNSSDLRSSMMATWSAENRLSQIRLAHEWPPLGSRQFDCPQGELQLVCEENVYTTPNPYFRRVEVIVLDVQSTTDSQSTGRHIIKLAQVVPNAQ